MLVRVILIPMRGRDVNQQPIQLLVNYWEVRPTLMAARLDELLRLGVTHVASFVPWQAVESDISHALPRFLESLADRKMTVSLILSPEVGVNFPNSGIPKDVLSKPETAARHCENGPVLVHLPPNVFALPSLMSPEFTKRFHNFLSRIDNFLADLGRNQPDILAGVTVVLTGSFWKYYRSARQSSLSAFGGAAGDYSGASGVAFRQYIDLFFAQKEFADPHPSSSNRWKTRALEEVNRRYFFQQSEDVFKGRSMQFVQRKALPVKVNQAELFTPEADPSFAYSNLFQLISGAGADFSRLSRLLDESVTRSSDGGENPSPSYVHWTGFGGFCALADAEKQFLILKSLILMGGSGGGVLIDHDEWFSLSQPFRARVEGLARMISNRHLSLRSRALYLAPHLWSAPGVLWGELFNRLGPSARVISSVDRVVRDPESTLLIVDPTFIFTKEAVSKLTHWVRGGRVLAIPRSPLYTEAARTELEQVLSRGKSMEITLGVSYRLQTIGDGRILLYDLPEGVSGQGEVLRSWQVFLNSLLSLSGIENYCAVSDGRLKVIPLEQARGGVGLFVVNGTNRPISASLVFREEVSISDLALVFTGKVLPSQVQAVPSTQFEFDVPPYGVLPIAVEGISREREESVLAALSSDSLDASIARAAFNELPGYRPMEGDQTPWN